jgi:hypothetical protein
MQDMRCLCLLPGVPLLSAPTSPYSVRWRAWIRVTITSVLMPSKSVASAVAALFFLAPTSWRSHRCKGWACAAMASVLSARTVLGPHLEALLLQSLGLSCNGIGADGAAV